MATTPISETPPQNLTEDEQQILRNRAGLKSANAFHITKHVLLFILADALMWFIANKYGNNIIGKLLSIHIAGYVWLVIVTGFWTMFYGTCLFKKAFVIIDERYGAIGVGSYNDPGSIREIGNKFQALRFGEKVVKTYNVVEPMITEPIEQVFTDKEGAQFKVTFYYPQTLMRGNLITLYKIGEKIGDRYFASTFRRRLQDKFGAEDGDKFVKEPKLLSDWLEGIFWGGNRMHPDEIKHAMFTGTPRVDRVIPSDETIAAKQALKNSANEVAAVKNLSAVGVDATTAYVLSKGGKVDLRAVSIVGSGLTPGLKEAIIAENTGNGKKTS